MKTRLYFSLALGLALALGAVGCSTDCQVLGERICQCEPEGQIRNNCKTNVKARVRAAAPSTSEEDYCSSVLGTCPDANGNVETCAWILNTCPGKVACGLALPLPDGCFSPCQELGERICQCVPEGPARESCKTDVILRAEIASPEDPEDQTCSGLLDTCSDPFGEVNACNVILTTCPGQVACGLATPVPGGGCTPIVLTSPLHGAGAP